MCAASIRTGDLVCPQCGADAPTEIAEEGTLPGVLALQGYDEHRSGIREALGPTFELRHMLGRGGFGEVWEALDLRLGRRVAVKVLRHELAASPAFRERFRRETRAVARLRHPGIVPVYHVGEAEGLVYFIMPLIEGITLKAALDAEGTLDPAEAVRILAEASDALREAHRRGIVHRDLKPENVMLDGPERRVLLMDFGIAQTEEGDRELTGAGLVLGSPEYMSPEQATGARQLDGRSDIYSLGVVGYRMLAGRLPFVADTAREALAHHAITPPEPLENVAPVPHGLSEAVMRCLAKKPDERWQTTDELLAALRPTVRSASSPALPQGFAPVAAPAHAAPAEPPSPRRGRTALAVGALALIGGGLIWAAMWWSGQHRWATAAVAIGDTYGAVTDSLRALTGRFRDGTMPGARVLAAQAALLQATDARIEGSFGGILDERGPWPADVRAGVESALHGAWAVVLSGGPVAVQAAGVAGCVTRNDGGVVVLEDRNARDNCWWGVAPPEPVAVPVEYTLAFQVPATIRADAGVGLAWCPPTGACWLVFVWSGGQVELAEYAAGSGLRRRRLGEPLPPLRGEQHLRVRADEARVRVWLGDAQVLDRAAPAEARALTRTEALRIVVQNAAITLPGASALQVVGDRP